MNGTNSAVDGGAASGTDIGLDVEALRAKYREERDRRLRPEGEEQYLRTAGEFAHYAEDDPHRDHDLDREPINTDIEVAVIGGGFSGLLAAARLHDAGIEDVHIIEAGSDFGGTWYWNRYPGAQCDVDSYCYLPLLEELEYLPKEKYSYAPEIYEHSRRIGEAYGLYERALLQTRVRKLEWNSDTSRWVISTNRGDTLCARFVISATGPASRPKLANIPGMSTFKGRSFHTGRWDYGYTGGNHSGNLSGLRDKKVAIIGTGATAIQCVPHVAADAAYLYVFQRTPSSVSARGNKPTDPAWAKTLKPGWQRERRENFNNVLTGMPFDVDHVNDGWTDIFRDLQQMIPTADAARADGADLAELADFKRMNALRNRIDEIVEDPKTAEALKPWYRLFCKRPTFNDAYLSAFNRPNVELVDTSASRGVERISETGVVANGVNYEVDLIIYATGFEIGTNLERRIDFEIIGKDDLSLFEHWKLGFRTFHGHSSHGFPNWFYVGVGQNGLSYNMTSMFDDQAAHIAFIIRSVRDRGAIAVQPSAEAEDNWVAEIRALAGNARPFLEACTPGYYNNEGRFDDAVGSVFAESYGPGANAFNDLIAAWRADGDLAGLELSFPAKDS